MKGWMEVFKAGRHVSSSGTPSEWDQGRLEQMAAAYDPVKHEAPIVVGHPKDNSPAYGWIKALKVVGDRLLALPGQVAPEFAELVKEGRYKKRSISVYPDGTLRHVGFLGGQPPAVKGLKDIDFAGETAETYEYADVEDAPMNELEKLKQELADEKKKRKEAEAERDQAQGTASTAQAEFAELQAKTKRQQIVDFVEQGVKDARILPTWKAQGLAEFMVALDGQTETYEFSEGKKQPPLEWFKGFLTSFSEHPLFKAMTAPQNDKDKASDFAEEDKLGEEIAAKVNPA